MMCSFKLRDAGYGLERVTIFVLLGISFLKKKIFVSILLRYFF
jgi:hypothetical protein